MKFLVMLIYSDIAGKASVD